MSSKRYPDEFKIEAVKQVTERGHAVADVGARLGVSQHSLYKWIKQFSVPPAERAEARSQQEEMRRLKAELRRVTEERDILKKAAAYFAKESR
jgi:transposase